MSGDGLMVVNAGISSLQDSGRSRWWASGVPRSGAFDMEAYELCSRLLGRVSLPSVEVLAGELVLRNDTTMVIPVSVVGGAQIELDGYTAASAVVLGLKPGDTLKVKAEIGKPGYVAAVGLSAQETLDSVSWDSFSRIGGGPLPSGQLLQVKTDEVLDYQGIGRFLRPSVKPYFPSGVVEMRVVQGPHYSQGVDRSVWSVQGVSRSGVRLGLDASDRAIGAPQGLTSFPVLPGCVQLTPSGQAIILGPDAGVTGGYPVVASLIAADIHRLARVGEGRQVRFRVISPEEAEAAWREQQHYFSSAVIDMGRI